MEINKEPQILLIEDDPIAVTITKRFLAGAAKIDTAINAETALEKTAEKKYSLILLDIGLRESLDGIQVLKLIRELPGYSSTPIIAFTAYAMESERIQFLSEGFNDILQKPFTKMELSEMIRKWIIS